VSIHASTLPRTIVLDYKLRGEGVSSQAENYLRTTKKPHGSSKLPEIA